MTQKDDVELKPCPFCGGNPEITTRDVEQQGDSWYGGKTATFVLCDCGACLFDGHFHEGFYDAETRAFAAWNKRAALDPSTEPVAYTSAERLQKIAENPGFAEMLWGKLLIEDGDVPLFTRPDADKRDVELGKLVRQAFSELSDSPVSLLLRIEGAIVEQDAALSQASKGNGND